MQLMAANDAVDAAWTATVGVVRQPSEHLSRSLPGFWKIAKACMDGRYRKVSVPRPC